MLDLSLNKENDILNYNLDVKLFEEFDLEIFDIMPLRKAFLISTNKGDKILKKINCTIDEFNFIISGVEYIKKNFTRVLNFMKTKDGKYYYINKGNLYCIMDMIDGKECEFSNPVDLSIAAYGLGELHKAAEGFKSSLQIKNNCGTLIESLIRKKDEMNFFKKISNLYEEKNEFDDIFIKNVDYNIEKINESVDILKKSQYLKLCSEEDKAVLCHHDLAHHNIIIKENKAYFIDFDYSIIDLKVHDLCNFISKVVKNFDYDINNAFVIMDNYCKVNSLNKSEVEVLYGILSFPEDFYAISRDYYSRRKDWQQEVFVSRLGKKILSEESRIEFLNEFKKEILDKY